MSQIQLNAFFDFCRVTVKKQSFDKEKQLVTIAIHPDERFDPVCHHCQRKVKRIHSSRERMVRDLSCIEAKTYLSVKYRTVRCAECGTVVEELDFVDPGKRVTKRLANSILSLCPYLTIKEIAEHLEIDWKTVKAIHKTHLQAKFSSYTQKLCLQVRKRWRILRS